MISIRKGIKWIEKKILVKKSTVWWAERSTVLYKNQRICASWAVSKKVGNKNEVTNEKLFRFSLSTKKKTALGHLTDLEITPFLPNTITALKKKRVTTPKYNIILVINEKMSWITRTNRLI